MLFYFVLQHLQQLGLVTTDRFMIAAGQGGGYIRELFSVGNVDQGEFSTIRTQLGERRPKWVAQQQRGQLVSKPEFRPRRERRERLRGERGA